MKKFKTIRHYATKIEPVEVIRETAEFVTVRCSGGSFREAKISDYQRFHDTWKEAHAYLLNRAQSNIRRLKDDLLAAKDELATLEAMVEPK